MPEPVPALPRIVPGAAPPDPAQKLNKKRRKQKPKSGPDSSADAIDNDHVDSPTTTVPGTLAPEPDPATEAETPTVPDELKLSPIVDLVTKRLKATTKKINRLTPYASMDPQDLNDDQRRSVKSLSGLEAVQKELTDVKKAIETHEAGLVHELIAKKLEAEKTERARIADAVTSAQKTSIIKTIDILNLLRLHSLLASGELDTSSTDQTEGSVIYAVADALLGAHDDKKKAVVEGFLQGSGNFDGISYIRLVEITAAGLAPPRIPTPSPVEETQEEEEQEEEQEEEREEEGVVEPEVAAEVTVAGIPGGLPKAKEISFVQESEIDETIETQPADDNDWTDVGAVVTDQVAQEELANGHAEHEAEPTSQAQEQEIAAPTIEERVTVAPLDWAADESELPPIASVQESFGTSGGVSPADHGQVESAPDGTNGHMNGPKPYRRTPQDEEGFTQTRGGRGRGRGFRGDRGGHGHRGFRSDRGGMRGERGERGGGHGGEGRSGFRGRGEGRGGHRGRGEWRGNGEHRGRGDWHNGEHRGRGEWQGGEHRGYGGRGRGRGRGGERGAAPATSASASGTAAGAAEAAAAAT